MREDQSHSVTRCIALARDGDARAREQLFELVYDDLKRIARGIPHVGKPGDTMQPTVLANEAFLEIERRFPMPPDGIPECRATFYRTVSLAMRTILRDYWRSKLAIKRGSGIAPLHLNVDALEANHADTNAGEQFLALDEALDVLERFNSRWYAVVMSRYFAGRTVAETAVMLGVSESLIVKDWKLARSWLRQEIDGRG